MYLTETDPTHTCSVAIVPPVNVPDDSTSEYEPREGERYLEEPAQRFEPTFEPMEIGQRAIGRYRLIRCLGRGVTGSVWHAQDSDSADRDVALKIMHADVHDEYVMARYTCEVRALARMDDPHIARIWENGQTIDGKLYIAMELVNGVQLSKYCEAWSPTIRERIALLVKLCRGMQHAHQRGILHRDLKPANILVTVQEHQVIPKIIDFGLAKSFHKPLLPGSADTTQMGCLLGTIGYMSPEQANTNTTTRDVDTRSDVYSLCAILYELLTGTLPIPRDELHQVSLARALEMIQLREPDFASRRVQKNPQVIMHSARCQLAPQKLSAALAGDLDAILDKGLSKEKERRYQSAGDLADDLERFLTGGVVQARRRTTWYVAQKLLRRHWKTALAISVIGLMFLISWVALAFGIYYAIGERNRAQQAESSLSASEVKERMHKLDAERSTQFLESVFSYPHPAKKGQEVKLLDALEWASRDVSSKLKEQPRAEAMVRLTLARMNLRLGQAHRAQLILEPLLFAPDRRFDELKPQILQGQVLLAQSLLEQDQLEESIHLCRSAQGHAQASANSEAELRSIYQTMAKALEAKKLYPEAARYLQEALSISGPGNQKAESEQLSVRSSILALHLRWARHDRSMVEKAISLARNTLQSASHLSASHPMSLQLQCQYAEALFLNQQIDQSYRILGEALQYAGDQHGKESIYAQLIQSNLAQLYLEDGQYRQAETILIDVVVPQQNILGNGHPATQQTLQSLVNVCQRGGKYWYGLDYALDLYQGQCQSQGISHKKSRATLENIQQLAARAGLQWMSWSLGNW